MPIATPNTVLHSAPVTETQSHAAPRGLVRRLIDAVADVRQRHAQHQVDVYVARTGGRITDAVERDMANHFLDYGRGFR